MKKEFISNTRVNLVKDILNWCKENQYTILSINYERLNIDEFKGIVNYTNKTLS